MESGTENIGNCHYAEVLAAGA